MKAPPRLSISANSWLARLAARRMGAGNGALALVIGSTIHLHGCSEAYFLKQKHWLRHEIEHVDQYRRMGTMRFLLVYFFQWIKKGYYRIPAEVEARTAERQAFPSIYYISLKQLLADYGVPWYLESDFAYMK